MVGIAGPVACGPKGELSASPSKLTWTQIDFAGWPDDLPEGGYDAQFITLSNTGSSRLDLVIEDFDFVHLCIEGYTESPVTLPPLNAGQAITVPVGVCGYDVVAGERDTLVRGEIAFDDDSLESPAIVSFQFTPFVDLSGGGDDTGG